MDFQRILLFVLLFCISSLTQAYTEPKQNHGIAFVHGTKDHREDAYGDYWKVDFIQSIATGLKNPENHYVVHCDFSKYMWHDDAALCVVDQLLAFINDKNLTSLTLYTHSNGANIIRWILSNPTYDNRFIALKRKIKEVVALAPSSSGTVLADEAVGGGVFNASVAWLLGYTSDAVRQQRVGDMLIFNDELLLGGKGRPSMSVPFKVIVGTDVAASPFSSSSYCNGYMLNSGLKLTKLYLDKCADGFLSCSSQKAAGEVWFYDKDKMQKGLSLSHNQSRHSCFGLDTILINALKTQRLAS